MNKIYNLSALQKKLSTKKKEKVVHCHGVFDLLHIGHIKYFEEAKSKGDILIVTVTPDRFVNKGPNRPVFNEIMRSEAIAALEIVDYVAINDWPTAVETIQLLKPDIYVKGPDYKDFKQDVTGNIKFEEDAVKSVGGKIGFTSGITFSSSTIVNEHFSSFSEDQKQFLTKIKSNYSFGEITKYVSSLSKQKVLLIGEAIIDEYIFCNTIGKSGKEPYLVTQKLNSEKYTGGILAVANQISEFCDSGEVLSYIGDRDNHLKFIESSVNKNINLDFIIKSNSPTILKSRFLDSYYNSKTLGVYDINDNLILEKEEKELILKIENKIKNYDLVLTVDYGHGLVTPNIVNLLEEKSKFLAVNTQLNASNIGYHTISKYKKSNYVCIHEGELRHDYRNRSDTVEDLVKDLSKRIESDIIVITRGKKGSIAWDNKDFLYCPAFASKIIDRVGAGDILLALTSLCFSAGLPTDLTLLIGNLAAAEKVASIGTGFKLSKTNLMKSIQSLLK